MSLSKEFRYYQEKADDAIYVELLVNNKCIAKKFCGTGKSLLMRKCKIAQNKKLVVYVFPSLSLIKQFCNDYFDKNDKSICLLKVSSDESGSTTDPVQIIKFLKKNPDKNKIICVTYQSYKTLLDNLGSTKINLCIYDEAHHAVAPKYQKYIFEDETNACEKQLFFTATPKDDNGVVMCDKEAGICGRTVYDYPYYQGLKDGYLNKFEIRVDMYTANTNYSIYESIARTTLITGNNRVLTFHADVNTDRDTSVLKFVNQTEFITAFNKVLKDEFPEKENVYTKFKMIGLDASINSENRENILNEFDTTPDNEVYIISSCETIGEGIDTKRANMCVFVDPKSSYVKIIQNIGRIVRPQSKTSTVLIPCWVDKDKYLDCGEDSEKRDEVIREDLINDRGNFNGILKVLSALKQEDEDLYDACLYYGEDVDNKINKSASIEEDNDSDSDSDSDSHSDSDSDSEDDELPINPKFKINVKFHTSDDIKVLWKISSDIDIMKNMCSCVLDCEVDVVDKWFERFEELKSFIDEHEETPSEKTNKKLGVWFSIQKQNYKNVLQGMKIKERYDLWTQFMIEYSKYFKTNEEIWNENFQKLKDFINTNNKKPSYKVGDKNEIKLGQWWRNQLVDYEGKYTKGRTIMNEQRKELWRQFLEEYKEYFKSNDNKWTVMFIKIIDFIETNKRRPSKSNDKSENDICNWYHNQCKQFKTKIGAFKQNENVKKWEEFITNYKVYFIDENEKWFGILNEVKIFMNKNKRRPNKETKLCNIEKRLGQWVGSQIQKYNGKKDCMNNEVIYNTWTLFIDEYKEYLKTDDELWIDKLKELEHFIYINKRRPVYSADEKSEKKLGQWLSTQNQLIVEDKMLENRYKMWLTLKEKYTEYLQNSDERWDEYFNNLIEFIVKNKRLPLGSAKDINERTLNTWMQHQKLAYSNKDKGMVDIKRYNKWTEFINKYEEYLKTDEEIWNEKYDKLVLFIETHKKRPNKRANNENEKMLGLWIGANLRNYKEKKMMNVERYNKWNELMNKYDKYFITNEEIWEEKFKEFKTFINLYSKLPNGKSKNNIEKSIGCWLCCQKRNFKDKSGIMKDTQIYSKWSQFLKEYKQYFENQTAEEPKEVIEEEEIIIIPKKKSMKLKKPSQGIITETTEQRRQRTKSELEILHQKYKTMKSENLKNEFQENPELWHQYHAISEENEKSFPEESIPRNCIIQELDKIKTNRTKKVVDMGCGKAQIADHFANDKRFSFINYDHVSSKENVEVQDISNIPLGENDVEICILCLAMWGSNCHDYIKEAYRILESGGILYIIEATKRWTEKDENGIVIECQQGDKLKKLLEENGFKIVCEKIEKFSYFKCTK